MSVAYEIFGYGEVFAEGEYVLSLINLCMTYNLPYGKVYRTSGGVCFLFRLGILKTLEELCRKRNIIIQIRKKGGLPIWIYKHRKRYGLAVGMVIAVFMIVFSQKFIWRIDVTGNETIPTSEILKVLDGQGLYAGSYIKKLNTDRIQNKILYESDKISWISINISGNIASVEIRERERSDTSENEKSPANLVASKSGKIEYLQIMHGNANVKSGDIVSEGQLLVGGIFDSHIDGYRLTRAEGKVFARTTAEFYVQIPYEYEEKVYTRKEYCDEYLNFFDFSIKILKKGGNSYAFYDKIHRVESYSFFDGGVLPISKSKDIYLEYTTRISKRSIEAAEELAYFELSQKMSEFSDDAILIRKVIMPEIGEDFFALRCVVECIEDIAQIAEIQVDNFAE